MEQNNLSLNNEQNTNITPASQTGQNFVPTEPLEQAANTAGETVQETHEGPYVASATAIPAQKQLPADTYIYANTSNLGGVIQHTSKQYDIDPHKLEALVNTIRNKKANLSGFYDMQVGYYPGMSAESFVTNLGRVADLSNTVSEKKRQDAKLRGEEFTGDGIDVLIDSLQSIDGKHEGKFYYYEALNAIQEADHIQFDTPTLAEYYETLVRSGVDKSKAWTQTMTKQDEYRKAQDTRAVYQDFQAMITPVEMQQYVNNLYEQVQNATDADTKIRTYAQYEAASKLAKSYAEAYKNDPATYFQTKDPSFNAILTEASESGSFADVVKALDERYDEYGVQYSDRKYLRKDQADAIAKEINTFINTDPIKAQAAIVSLNQTYGVHANKVISQLIADEEVPAAAKLLIESARTGSPKTNEAVIDMIKHKATLGKNFDMEMLGAPDSSSAKALRDKLELQIAELPGVKALSKQFNLTGNVAGQREMIQYYGDMAAYYKFKNPRMSDKDIAKLVQKDLISTIYAFDTDDRVALQHRTLDGKPILYNGYNAEQAKDYLSNRKFTGQKISIGALSQDASEQLLRNSDKIRYITLDQYTVQPVYDDGNGTVQALFTGTGENRKAMTINLKTLGDEDILGVFDARDNARKLYKTLNQLVNIPTPYEMARLGATLDDNSANAMKALRTLGFQIDKFDTTKPFAEQFNRSEMSPRRIQAMSTLLKKQVEFEQELKVYERMKKVQRNNARPRLIAAELVGPFLHTMLLPPKNGEESSLEKRFKAYERDKQALYPELKAQRVKLQMIEKTIMNEAAIYLNYKGKLPNNPLTKEIHEHNLMDKVLWGGYGY